MTYQSFLVRALVLSSFAASCSASGTLSPSRVADSSAYQPLSVAESRRLEDRAQAVLYRWLFFYETAEPNFEEQYEILTEDLTIKGTVQIHSLAEYKKSLEAPYFVFGQNAHHVEDVVFTKVTSESVRLSATVLYQGVDKKGEIHSYRLHYAIQMVASKSNLPRIKMMTINSVAEAEPIFLSTYRENRAKAQMFEERGRSRMDLNGSGI